MQFQKHAILPQHVHPPLNQARSVTHSSSVLATRTRSLSRHHLRSPKLLIFTLNIAIDSRSGVLIVRRSRTQLICQRSSFVAYSP